MQTIGIIFGGPGPERGISINSARSLLSHLDPSIYKAISFFVDQSCEFYQVNNACLLSNTPCDFDFKLSEVGHHLPPHQLQHALQTIDLAFPVIHGEFGEDGQLSAMLTAMNIPYIGNTEATCKRCYQKQAAIHNLNQHNFNTLPTLTLSTSPKHLNDLSDFWQAFVANQSNKLVLKPNAGGSSIGVHITTSLSHAKKQAQMLLKTYPSIVCQPYQSGTEITIIVLDSAKGPIALIPTETERQHKQLDFLDYRSKYLPTNQCRHYTPSRHSPEAITVIQQQSEAIFQALNLRDIARLDGWYDPKIGFICNDINLISGLEENSFLFKQTSALGLTHRQTIHQLIMHANQREKPTTPKPPIRPTKKTPVHVIFGGQSNEKNVSLMSGRNVWLQLKKSKIYEPLACYLDSELNCWTLPYHLFLNHTTEEIDDGIQHHNQHHAMLSAQAGRLKQHLNHEYQPLCQSPKGVSLKTWLNCIQKKNQQQPEPVFIALHGGIGEDGRLQAMLNERQIPYQGSGPLSSQLCMNKHETQTHLSQAQLKQLTVMKQISLSRSTLIEHSELSDVDAIWPQYQASLQSQKLIIKPQSDGCSSGVVILSNVGDYLRYADFIKNKISLAPSSSFTNQTAPIEIPHHSDDFLIEPYIETDELYVSNHTLTHKKTSGWLECTTVVIQNPSDQSYQALPSSITVKQAGILSLEEKFQGGTGINLTPPPSAIISQDLQDWLSQKLCAIAKHFDLRHYARIDFFIHPQKQSLCLIEINTLPALTPSTVLFQQALASTPPIQPLAFLEMLVTQSQVKESPRPANPTKLLI